MMRGDRVCHEQSEIRVRLLFRSSEANPFRVPSPPKEEGGSWVEVGFQRDAARPVDLSFSRHESGGNSSLSAPERGGTQPAKRRPLEGFSY